MIEENIPLVQMQAKIDWLEYRVEKLGHIVEVLQLRIIELKVKGAKNAD